MANKIWIATTGDLETDGNWSPSGFPEEDDNILFSGKYSNQSVTSGLSPTYKYKYGTIEVDSTYTGQIGDVGNALRVAASKVIHKGSGEFHYRSDNDDASSTTDVIICNTPNNPFGSDLLYIDCQNTDALIGRIIIVRGAARIISTCNALGAVEVARYTSSSDAKLTIAAADSTQIITALYQAGGYVISDREITTAYQSAGTLKQGTDRIVTLVQSGGKCIYNSPSGDGTMTALYGLGGTFDMTQTGEYKTVTTYRGYPGHTLLRNKDVHTVTNEYDVAWAGGN